MSPPASSAHVCIRTSIPPRTPRYVSRPPLQHFNADTPVLTLSIHLRTHSRPRLRAYVPPCQPTSHPPQNTRTRSSFGIGSSCGASVTRPNCFTLCAMVSATLDASSRKNYCQTALPGRDPDRRGRQCPPPTLLLWASVCIVYGRS